MVVGNGTNVFTLSDVVSFGFTQKYNVPLLIEADKKMCLSGQGNGVNNTELCTQFGAEATNSYQTYNNGQTNYIVMGNGYYQTRNPDGTYSR